ncbi:MAG: 4Fe-4S cluster-binding domain-containing protein [Dehalococcoidales bacterium]|nr:MAG: 4Fe-4S cluster-binding domain-containing protein [Dehalococcoidales bacterium]
MLTGLHLLLTYQCNSECDHCFLYCSPRSQGTFTLNQIRTLLDEARKIDTLKSIYFEGGEAFLYYPVLLEGIRMVRKAGFSVGVVTNAFFATDDEDIRLWLKPLVELGISDLSLSNDPYHYGEEKDNPATRTRKIALELGLPVGEIHIDEPSVIKDEAHEKGEAIIGGSTMFRGRAVDKLIEGLPTRYWENFTECSYENLESPGRVHIDAYGNIHICQGISMGNVWQTPLSEIDNTWNADLHPVCGPLVKNGPAGLIREYDIDHENEYVDVCHCCYQIRKSLLDRFPQHLCPPQVYGVELTSNT